MIDSFIDKFEKAVPSKKTRRVLLHLIFWLIWLSRSFYDTETVWGIQSSLYFVAVVFATQLPLVYIHLYVLVPYLLNKRRYVIHIVVTILLIITYSFCNYFLLKSIPAEYLSTNMNAFLRGLKPNYDLLEGFIVVVLTYSLKYMLIAFITQNELLKVQKEKLQLELRALKAQINPHFFFNTLNNLYSLTLKNSHQSSEVVLKLSDMMRYVLYECNEDKVLLSKEIYFIRNYLELERLRFNTSYQIDYRQEGEADKQVVAPMLMVEFIENSFKHGLNRHFSSGWVRLEIKIASDQLDFIISNSLGSQEDDRETSKSGIGLINIKKRLALIYPDQYMLKIEEKPELFRVHLHLELKS
jgi:two-component system LytT family sensor kinase